MASTGKLEAYNRKRDFDRTAEPEGAPDPAATRATAHEGPLRYAMQHHLASRDHYDLRLEWDGALLSWAVPKGPSYNPRDKRLAVHVEDHPLAYRTFEGTIPKGEYGGGTVMLWDEGTWEPHGDVDAALARGELKFTLHGQRLRGDWVLVHLKPRPGEKGDDWLLIKERDGFVQDEPGIAQFDTSVSTGRTMGEIADGDDERLPRNPFDRVEVELAKLVAAPPAGGGWLYEVKYDGYRIVSYVEGGACRLMTRNNLDYADRFPEIASSLVTWAAGRALVVDGELAVADEAGRTDFQALQGFLRNPRDKHPIYLAFDLLALDGEDLRGLPLEERKRRLAALLEGVPADIRYSAHVQDQGEESFQAACGLHLEGVVGKRADSPYRSGRVGDWVKLKCDRRQEFVIGGFTRTEKKATGISALLLGAYDGSGRLAYVGRVGSGLGAPEVRELEAAFAGLARKDAPFADPPKPRPREQAFWLEPQLVAEVRFTEWTDEGLLRHPSYQGLRTDKDPHDVRREDAEGAAESRPPHGVAAYEQEEPMETIAPERPAAAAAQRGPAAAKRSSGTSVVIDGVTITSPDKVMFANPGVTKEQVVRYYERIAERMMPYAGGRVLSIVRCPRGLASSCFFRKHPGSQMKGVATIDVVGSDGGHDEYIYLENATGLISEAQMDTLEFHVWGSRIATLEQPDTMVFDLDPDEGLDLARVRAGVRDLKGLLDELSLTSFLKTSGGKGYHVVVPFAPEASWEAFHDFAKRIAQVMEQKWPDRYTSNVRKARRAGRIFIDWMRNGRGATSIAPYSLRARDGARVSLPIAWEELDQVAPDAITMDEALARSEQPDPWQGFAACRQALK